MKKLAILLFVVVIAVSCKTDAKKEIKKEEKFPTNLGKVFDAHGGIDNWRAARTLSFNKGDEAHTVDLWSRKTMINAPTYSLGFDGKDVWVSDTIAFKGNPTFYYNLYFYFYAMPFVLADDGIVYEDAKPITFKGKEYPGIKVSYEANVGTSPDDNYIVYYDAETFQMEWLAYTVTFRSKKPSDRYNLLKYDAWESVDGFQMPKKILWYKKDDQGNPTEPQGTPTDFTLPLVKKTPLKPEFFNKITAAKE